MGQLVGLFVRLLDQPTCNLATVPLCLFYVFYSFCFLFSFIQRLGHEQFVIEYYSVGDGKVVSTAEIVPGGDRRVAVGVTLPLNAGVDVGVFVAVAVGKGGMVAALGISRVSLSFCRLPTALETQPDQRPDKRQPYHRDPIHALLRNDLYSLARLNLLNSQTFGLLDSYPIRKPL